MPNESHDKLNKLLGRQGSLDKRSKLARELNDEQLQIAASAGIPQAKEEQERRRHESLLAARVQFTSQGTGNAAEFAYVDPTRLIELRAVSSSQFDLTKLIQLCEELNKCYSVECYFAIAMLTRAVLDHVPPIFGQSTFSQLANSYSGSRSFKKSMQHLENSLRNIADAHLHIQIQPKEVIPNKAQMNFSNDLDILLAEIVRLLK